MQTQVTIELPGPLLLAAVSPPPRAPAGAPRRTLDPHLDELARQLDRHLAAEVDQVARARGALEAAGAEFARAQTDFFAQAEAQVVALALDVARKVLAQNVEARAYGIGPIVREALAGVARCGQVTVHLNPADLARCAQASDAPGDAGAEVTFVADDTVPPAGCRLQTGQGQVVSTIDGRMNDISKALTNPE